MELAMPVVWSERCLLHQPLAEIWIGLRTPAAETPDRIERIRSALDGATFVEAQPHDDTILPAVVTLQPGTRDGEWLAAVGELADWAREADGLVISLGVDAAAEDPESPLEDTRDGFREAGALLGALGLPTVFVQEGGYHDAIGELVRETLLGFEAA